MHDLAGTQFNRLPPVNIDDRHRSAHFGNAVGSIRNGERSPAGQSPGFGCGGGCWSCHEPSHSIERVSRFGPVGVQSVRGQSCSHFVSLGAGVSKVAERVAGSTDVALCTRGFRQDRRAEHCHSWDAGRDSIWPQSSGAVCTRVGSRRTNHCQWISSWY